MDKQLMILEFKDKTGIDFLFANEHYYRDLPEDIMCYAMLSLDDIDNVDETNFKKVYDFLFSLAIGKEKVRKSIDAKKIDSFYIDSIERCMGCKRRDTTNTDFLIASTLINEDVIKNVLVRNPGIAFNPLFLMNNGYGQDTCKLIFIPSRRLITRLKFIYPIYKGKNLKGYDVDINYLKSYGRFSIQEDDIKGINLGMYHPYIWGLIQNEQFSSLVHNI